MININTSHISIKMGYPETAEGFMVKDQKDWKSFHKEEFKLKPFEDRDIDIAIECCGVCGSDVHTINGGWGEAPMPICVGHEVVGKVCVRPMHRHLRPKLIAFVLPRLSRLAKTSRRSRLETVLVLEHRSRQT